MSNVSELNPNSLPPCGDGVPSLASSLVKASSKSKEPRGPEARRKLGDLEGINTTEDGSSLNGLFLLILSSIDGVNWEALGKDGDESSIGHCDGLGRSVLRLAVDLCRRETG